MSGSSLNPLIPALPASILCELYPDSLIRLPAAGMPQLIEAKPEDKNTPPPTETAATPSSLGENRKGIIIGVAYADVATIRENELTFLLNILNACKLGLRDVVILNLHGIPTSTKQQLHKTYPASVFLMFGLSAADLSLPVRFPEYQRQVFDGIQYLAAPPLAALENDAIAKKQLWACLKALFLNA
jgi:hypothetical protein